MTAAAAVRYATVRPAPRREPPFDDEVDHPPLRLVRAQALELPFPDLRPVRPAVPVERPAAVGEPELWARRLLVGLSECAGGRRPLRQLGRLVNPMLLRGLGHDLERADSGRPRHWLAGATVRSLHVSEPAEGVAEVAAVLSAGRRVRALALRLEVRHGRWQCVRLELA